MDERDFPAADFGPVLRAAFFRLAMLLAEGWGSGDEVDDAMETVP